MYRLPTYKRIVWEGGFKVRLFRQWLLNRNKKDFSERVPVSLKEILGLVLGPSRSMRGKSFIRAIEEYDENNLRIYYKEISFPLYFPKSVYLEILYFITEEIFNKDNWHYYDIPQTTVTKDDIIVDCGAAEGAFTLKLVNKVKKAYLIEPVSKYINSLEKTFKKFKNIEIIPYAVAEKKSNGWMDDCTIISSKQKRPGMKISPVSITTIDDLFFSQNRKITYLKADLEGSDFDMLKGAKNTIKKYKPKIAITTYHKKEHARQIYNFLKKLIPEYKIKIKGIDSRMGNPIMLHAWIDK